MSIFVSIALCPYSLNRNVFSSPIKEEEEERILSPPSRCPDLIILPSKLLYLFWSSRMSTMTINRLDFAHSVSCTLRSIVRWLLIWSHEKLRHPLSLWIVITETTSEVTSEIRSWRLLITKLHDLRVISGTHWKLHATDRTWYASCRSGTKSFLWKWRSWDSSDSPFRAHIPLGSDGRCQIIRLVHPDRRTCEDKERTRVLGGSFKRIQKQKEKAPKCPSKSQTSHFHPHMRTESCP